MPFASSSFSSSVPSKYTFKNPSNVITSPFATNNRKDSNWTFTINTQDLAKIVNKSMKVGDSVFRESKIFEKWFKAWEKEINVGDIFQEMNLKNPCYIPRNHLIEDALKHANNEDMTEIKLMNKLLESPFKEKDSYEIYTMPSTSDEHYVTYCGT